MEEIKNDFLWYEIDLSRRDEYKKMITQFASLTELFAQKKDRASEDVGSKKKLQKPFISSKFQETVFKYAFDASIEDIGNTSYDASLDPEVVRKPKGKNAEECSEKGGSNKRYLFGIKTFLVNDQSPDSFQKIAQFKAVAESLESANGEKSWGDIIEDIRKNAKKCKTKKEINEINKGCYEALAKKIAKARNGRIEASKALIAKRLQDDVQKTEFEAVYHFLMPSAQVNGNEEKKVIYLGEIPYKKIGEKIKIKGITDVKHPTNFIFEDEFNNEYKYTSADSQLYMKFKHEPVKDETWPVDFVENPYECFKSFFEKIAQEEEDKSELETAVQDGRSFSFLIQLEKYSGFNNFYGLSSKLSCSARNQTLDKIRKWGEKEKDSDVCSIAKGIGNFMNMKINISTRLRSNICDQIGNLAIGEKNEENLKNLANTLNAYFGTDDKENLIDRKRILARDELTTKINALLEKNPVRYKEVSDWAFSLLWRTAYEMYIRLPISFNRMHPDFFKKGLFKIEENGKLNFVGKREKFKMSFGPLKDDEIEMHLTQSSGKGLQSSGSQTRLGEWILRDVFQLKKWEPLTEQKLRESRINGFRLKKDETGLIHFEFIWIDVGNPPIDFWGGRD